MAKIVKSKLGRAAYGRTGFWLADDNSVHVTMPGVRGFHVRISDDPTKSWGHPRLHRLFKQALNAATPQD
jgi:hypothetical protein